MAKFDYVIVGAGSAGCVLANRLSENPNLSICLIEAGGSDWSPFIHIPAGWASNFNNPRVDWGYHTAPEIELNERKIFWPRGKVLGGSSAINGMIYIRGVPLDFAAWEQAGAKGWSWEEVLPYYKKQRLSKPIKMIYMETMAPCMSRTLETKGLSMTFTWMRWNP